MTGWFNPDGWVDLVSQILLIVGGLAIAIVPSWIAARSHRSITRVESQVANGHTTPMRADLDRAILAIEALAHDVTGLRRDLADEENRRRDHIAELRDEVNRKLGRRAS
jgi:hypothetical protein